MLRKIVREVCSEYTVCAQAQPLKTKEKLEHILAKVPFERVIIDLIDIYAYKDQN
jgi:hypothetical protein